MKEKEKKERKEEEEAYSVRYHIWMTEDIQYIFSNIVI